MYATQNIHILTAVLYNDYCINIDLEKVTTCNIELNLSSIANDQKKEIERRPFVCH